MIVRRNESLCIELRVGGQVDEPGYGGGVLHVAGGGEEGEVDGAVGEPPGHLLVVSGDDEPDGNARLRGDEVGERLEGGKHSVRVVNGVDGENIVFRCVRRGKPQEAESNEKQQESSETTP